MDVNLGLEYTKWLHVLSITSLLISPLILLMQLRNDDIGGWGGISTDVRFADYVSMRGAIHVL